MFQKRNWIFIILGCIFFIVGIRNLFVVVNDSILPILRNENSFKGDFGLSYEMGKTAFSSPEKLYNCIPDKGTKVLLLDRTVFHPYPPPAALFFRIFSLIPFSWAYLVWTFTIYLIVAVSCYLFLMPVIKGTSQPFSSAFPILLCLAAAPTYLDAYFGNVNAVMLLLCITYAILLHNRRAFFAGLVLSVAFWLKLYPVLLLVLLLNDRKWCRATIGFITGVLSIFLLSLIIIPFAKYTEFFLQIAPAYSRQTEIHAFNQSLIAAIYRVLYGTPFPQYELVLIPFWMRTLIYLLIPTALTFVYMVARKRGQQISSLSATAFICALIPLITPIGWGYTFVMTYPALIILYSMGAGKNWISGILYSILWLSLAVPSYYEFSTITLLPRSFSGVEVKAVLSRCIQMLIYNRYTLVNLIVIVWLGLKMTRKEFNANKLVQREMDTV